MLRLNTGLVTEDDFVNWVRSQNGVLHTRKVSNISTTNLSECPPNTIVCLTGYSQIVHIFFKDIIKNFKNKIILITLETDGFDMRNEYLSNPLLYHWFTWNKPIQHEKLTCIPIGLNFDRHHNSIVNYINGDNNNNIRDKLFAVNLSVSSNPDRIKLIQTAKTKWSGFCTHIDNIPFLNTYRRQSIIEGKIKVDVTNPKCYEILSKYKFILSPPGAGIDCHRTWEALYCGTIPIIIESSINELYRDLPVLIVNSWEEITEDLLEKKYVEIQNNIKNDKYNMKKMYMNYWTNEIDKKIKVVSPFQSLEKLNINSYKPIHFITYGNHRFKNSKERLLREAQEFGAFKTITGYGPNFMSREFLEKHKDILTQPRGGGYWIWRPNLLLEALNKIEDGEFLVYLDAGCKLNPYGKKRFYEYIDMINNTDYGIMSFQMSGNLGQGNLEKENKWTNREIFNYLNESTNGKNANTGQFLGGILVMKKNQHLLKIINLLIKALEDDSLMYTDHYNTNQHPEFKENRHEQSLFSLLRKIHGSVVLDGDESFMVPFGSHESMKYPFWAARIKG
tara:strand:+ start:4092 stop:5777 length:1686 start_codon:yes stop_codon:yes gene_type:complete